MLILAMDPSGSFIEGKGTTGYSLWYAGEYAPITVGELAAKDYATQQDYWNAHINLINVIKPDILVIEDYLLYADKAKQQIGSKMETSQMLGIIKYECSKKNRKIIMQKAVEVKTRFNDDILTNLEILECVNNRYYISTRSGRRLITSRHIRDSIRHYMLYDLKKRKGKYE